MRVYSQKNVEEVWVIPGRTINMFSAGLKEGNDVYVFVCFLLWVIGSWGERNVAAE